MKKLFLSLSLMLTVGLSTTFAREGPGAGEEALKTFNKEFAGAESVVWKEAGDYFKANFIYCGYVTEAYFTTDGELKGSVRFLSFNQLPLNVITTVNKKFIDAEVLDAYEINNENGTSYRLTFKLDSKKYRIRIDAAGGILEKEKLKN
jgi:hypothetical protein